MCCAFLVVSDCSPPWRGAFASFPPSQLDHLGGFLNHCTFWVLLCLRVGQRGLQGWCLISVLLLLQTPPRTSLSGDALGREGPGLPLPGWALVSAPFLEAAKASVGFLWLDTQQALQVLGGKDTPPAGLQAGCRYIPRVVWVQPVGIRFSSEVAEGTCHISKYYTYYMPVCVSGCV